MTATTLTRLAAYRQRRDHFFHHHDDSPLEPADRPDFAGLDYFPAAEALVFARELDVSGPGIGEQVDLLTISGELKPFLRAGRVHLPINGPTVTLSVFRDLGRGRYFLPFRDGTAGRETYGGGRYLDPQRRPDGSLVVDFNYAYNPYCAYSMGWSCPIPPAENITSVRIEAGERVYRRRAVADRG